MIERRSAPGRLPIPRQIYLAAMVGLVLLAGFLFLQTPPLVTAFRALAELLAMSVAAILRASGVSIVRSGIELRDSVTGHAVAVTGACDGSSLVIATAAVAIWLWRSGKRDLLLVAVASLIAIFGFNLVRVLLLFFSIGSPVLLEVQHLYVAPLISAVLVASLVAVGLGVPLRDAVGAPMLWVGVAVGAAILWYPLAQIVTCNSAVPIANTLLWLAPGELERAIACRAGDGIVTTSGVVGLAPVRVLEVQLYPTDFTLAAPLVVASLAMIHRPAVIVGATLVALFLFSIALTLGAMTASQDAATGANVTVLMEHGFGAAFTPMSDNVLALLKAAQNALVHFNLFLLPLALLPATAIAAGQPAAAAGSTGRGRGRARGRARRR